MRPEEKEKQQTEDLRPEEALPEDVIDAVSGGLDQEMIDNIRKNNPDLYENMWLLGYI